MLFVGHTTSKYIPYKLFVATRTKDTLKLTMTGESLHSTRVL